MRYILRFLRLLWQILIVGTYVVGCWLFWLIRYSNHPERYPLELRYRRLRSMVRFMFWGFAVKINTTGKENIDNISGRFVLMGNHRSVVDALVLIAVSERPITFASKIEATKYPIIGRAIRSIEGVFLDRDDLRQQLKMMKYIESEMRDNPNRQWVIFPEGTRNKDGGPFDLLEFHHGSFRAPLTENIPVIPTTMFGVPRILNKKYTWDIPVQVHFGAPILPNQDNHIVSSNDFAQYTRERMLENMGIIVKRDPVYKREQRRLENKRIKEEMKASKGKS